jgi:hypothetical protein
MISQHGAVTKPSYHVTSDSDLRFEARNGGQNGGRLSVQYAIPHSTARMKRRRRRRLPRVLDWQLALLVQLSMNN